jgi:glycerol uptake facilitator-like aquaporin
MECCLTAALLLLLLLRARVCTGPAIVFGCNWKAVPVYILAELLGGVAGSVISWPLYGTGLQFGRCKDVVVYNQFCLLPPLPIARFAFCEICLSPQHTNLT